VVVDVSRGAGLTQGLQGLTKVDACMVPTEEDTGEITCVLDLKGVLGKLAESLLLGRVQYLD
jgi:hypothetical protein